MALALAFYWRAFGGGFIFDDLNNLVFLEDWKVVDGTAEEWRRAASSGLASSFGRPLAMLSFALNHYFTGMDPWAMKATNALIHAINTALVFLLGREVLNRGQPGESRDACLVAAALVAVAWFAHPLQTSSVLYIVQRMELGAATFMLVALLAYCRWRTGTHPARHGWLLLAAASSLLGFGFKETAILTPVFAFAIELFIFRFRTPCGVFSRPLAAAYAVGAVSAAAAYLVLVLPGGLDPEVYAFRNFTPSERAWTQLAVLSNYLVQMLLPLPEQLVFYYDNFPISNGLFSPLSTAWGAALLGGLIVTSAVLRNRLPLVSFGIAWFFVAHLLTSSPLPLELAFEHRNYLALWGLLLALVSLIMAATRRLGWDARATLGLLPVALIAGLGSLHVNEWRDPVALALTLASKNPTSERATYSAGRVLLEQAQGDTSSPAWSFAYREFDHARTIPRSSPLPEQALIRMKSSTGQTVPPELWKSFRAKLTSGRRAGPQEETALFGVLQCRIDENCEFDDEQLYGTLLAAIRENPSSPVIHNLLGNFAWTVAGDRPWAVQLVQEAGRLAPGNRQFQRNLLEMYEAEPRLAGPGDIEALRLALGETTNMR